MSSRGDECFSKLLDHTWSCHENQSPSIECQRHSATGLVHCVLKRTKTAPSLLQRPDSPMYHFYIETSTTSGEEVFEQLILTAVKTSGHSYSIYSISTSTDDSNGLGMEIGSLARVQMNMYSISYVLKNSSNVSMAYIVYHVPSPIKVIRDKPSRFAELAIHHPPTSKFETNDRHYNDKSNEETKAIMTPSSSYFDRVCQYSISHHRNLSGVAAIAEYDPSIRVLTSQSPVISSSGRATLNFRGRGKYASPKNMQLIFTPTMSPQSAVAQKTVTAVSRDPGTSTLASSIGRVKIYMQMCKWDTDTYHIDFDVPTVTHLHAFAFGLAQIDL